MNTSDHSALPRAADALASAMAHYLVDHCGFDLRWFTDEATLRAPVTEVTADVQLASAEATHAFAHTLGRLAARAYFAGKLSMGGAQ